MLRSSSIQSFSFLLLDISFVHIFSLFPGPLVYLNKFLYNKPKGFLLDEIDIDDSDVIDDSENINASYNLDASEDIDCELDTELELLTRMNGLTVDMMPEIDRFYITLQFKLVKEMLFWVKQIIYNEEKELRKNDSRMNTVGMLNTCKLDRKHGKWYFQWQTAAVIHRMQVLSRMIGRKVSVVGFLSLPSNPRVQPWTGSGNYQAATADDKPEKGEDDVKSSCPLCPGKHTCYNGWDKGFETKLLLRRIDGAIQDGLATPGKRIKEASDYFMHAPLGSGGYSSVGRALLLQLGHCDYRVPSSKISGEEDQAGPYEQLDPLSPFNSLRKMRQKKRKKIHGPTPSSLPRRN
ncbi:hypothetical protein FXO37_23986 [Capsicum annuum]|nr:hypothetical protein FXO37_23986 [Capsicum annuum]